MTTTQTYVGLTNEAPARNRAMRPPGGDSNFSLGYPDYSQRADRPAQQTQQFQQPQSQQYPPQPNFDRVHPLEARKRSQAAQEPGMTHGRIFGDEPESPAAAAVSPVRPSDMPQGQMLDMSPPRESAPPPGPYLPASPQGPMSPNWPQGPNGVTPNRSRHHNPNMTGNGYNPITGEVTGEGAAFKEAPSRVKKVMQPPGGSSGGLW